MQSGPAHGRYRLHRIEGFYFGAWPRGVHAPPGPLFQLVAAERRWTGRPSQGLARNLNRFSHCPMRCPRAVFALRRNLQKPRNSAPQAGFSERARQDSNL